VETGIDVAEALELVAHNCRQNALRTSLLSILEDISNGNSLSAAVSAQEAVLGNYVAASIQAGEASGKLADVLRQITVQLEEELSIRSTIVAALAYPAILCAASSVVAAILVWFVLPQFENSFASMGVEPPLITSVLFRIANFLRHNIALVAVGSLAVAGFSWFLALQSASRELFYSLGFRSPLLGPSLTNLAVGQLFLRIGHLLNNGISLLEAIQLTQRATSKGPLSKLLDAWEQDVMEGKGLTYSLSTFRQLPDGAEAMLMMAERTGKLAQVLTTAGAYYRDEGSNRLRQVLKLSEPIIIIGLGVFVGVVVASVLLPILDVQAGAAG
jgi:type II secretory pathway component PulF